MYKVGVKIRDMPGMYDVPEVVVYTDIYAANADDAVASVVVQKKIDKGDIVFIHSDMVY